MGVLAHVDQWPIVQSGAANGLLVNRESEGMDQVQDAGRGSAESGNVTRVRRNFRLDENDVERFLEDWRAQASGIARRRMAHGHP